MGRASRIWFLLLSLSSVFWSSGIRRHLEWVFSRITGQRLMSFPSHLLLVFGLSLYHSRSLQHIGGMRSYHGAVTRASGELRTVPRGRVLTDCARVLCSHRPPWTGFDGSRCTRGIVPAISPTCVNNQTKTKHKIIRIMIRVVIHTSSTRHGILRP